MAWNMKRFSFNVITAVTVVLATALNTRAQPLTIRTLAGSVAPGATNGFGSNARFNRPNGVAADRSGNVYVADTENGTVRKITADGYVSTIAGVAGSYGSTDGSAGNARFYGPQGIAAGQAGELFIADTVNSTIRKISSAGIVSTLAGAAGSFNSFDGPGANAQFYHPESLTADASGNLYVADTWNHTIRKITPSGVVSTLAGLADNFGSVDGTNSKARFHRPEGIDVDAATNLFVTDTFNQTIRKITPAGKVTTITGLAGVWGSADGTNSSARFYLPQGIAVASSGDLFVADSGNQTLRKVSPSGTNWVVTTVAGLSGTAGTTNGAGNSARFYFPAGVAVDGLGYVYVADMANNMARTTRVVPPTLQFITVGNQLVLSWPVSAEGFVLEQSATMGSSAAWLPATNGVAALGDNFVRTNSLMGTAYYRLRFP